MISALIQRKLTDRQPIDNINLSILQTLRVMGKRCWFGMLNGSGATLSDVMRKLPDKWFYWCSSWRSTKLPNYRIQGCGRFPEIWTFYMWTQRNWELRRQGKWSLNRQFQCKSIKNYRVQTAQNRPLTKNFAKIQENKHISGKEPFALGDNTVNTTLTFCVKFFCRHKFTFASNVNNGFHGNKWLCSPSLFAFPWKGLWRNTNANVNVTYDWTLTCRQPSLRFIYLFTVLTNNKIRILCLTKHWYFISCKKHKACMSAQQQ